MSTVSAPRGFGTVSDNMDDISSQFPTNADPEKTLERTINAPIRPPPRPPIVKKSVSNIPAPSLPRTILPSPRHSGNYPRNVSVLKPHQKVNPSLSSSTHHVGGRPLNHNSRANRAQVQANQGKRQVPCASPRSRATGLYSLFSTAPLQNLTNEPGKPDITPGRPLSQVPLQPVPKALQPIVRSAYHEPKGPGNTPEEPARKLRRVDEITLRPEPLSAGPKLCSACALEHLVSPNSDSSSQQTYLSLTQRCSFYQNIDSRLVFCEACWRRQVEQSNAGREEQPVGILMSILPLHRQIRAYFAKENNSGGAELGHDYIRTSERANIVSNRVYQ